MECRYKIAGLTTKSLQEHPTACTCDSCSQRGIMVDGNSLCSRKLQGDLDSLQLSNIKSSIVDENEAQFIVHHQQAKLEVEVRVGNEVTQEQRPCIECTVQRRVWGIITITGYNCSTSAQLTTHKPRLLDYIIINTAQGQGEYLPQTMTIVWLISFCNPRTKFTLVQGRHQFQTFFRTDMILLLHQLGLVQIFSLSVHSDDTIM